MFRSIEIQVEDDVLRVLQKLVWLPIGALLFSAQACSKDEGFLEYPRTQLAVQKLVDEHGYDAELVKQWMLNGNYREAPVKKIAAPAETTKKYKEYKPMFVAAATIRQGRSFLEKHADLLEKAETTYGVPKEIIVSIIGIESKFGRTLGRHKTFDALGTLAVTEGRRADYFLREWVKFIVISVERGVDPLKVKGSYAGATGYPQFMPTSFEAYAVDHDNDGDIDIWNDPYDAIGSVAFYLKENGWKRDQKIVSPAKVEKDGLIKTNSLERDRKLVDVAEAGWTVEGLMETEGFVFPIRLDTDTGPEYWLGYRNFWSISRYNRSISYSMAVFQLAEEIIK